LYLSPAKLCDWIVRNLPSDVSVDLFYSAQFSQGLKDKNFIVASVKEIFRSGNVNKKVSSVTTKLVVV